MRYYLDTEFNGFGGALLSLALVRQDGASFYAVSGEKPYKLDEWVDDNVLPIMEDVPDHVTINRPKSAEGMAWMLAHFLAGDPAPHIVTDWPDDVRHFCNAVITGPGTMIPVRGLSFEVVRVDAYPTTLPDAVQHNAWWDAMALRHLLTGSQASSQSDGEAGQGEAGQRPNQNPTPHKEGNS